MSYPEFQSRQSQTQVFAVGKTPEFGPYSQGPTMDLGEKAIGIVSLATATISDVNLDGAASFPSLALNVICSFDDLNWGQTVTVASGFYSNYLPTWGFFTADDPTPIYTLFSSARFLRFTWGWYAADLGDNASANITARLDYF